MNTLSTSARRTLTLSASAVLGLTLLAGCSGANTASSPSASTSQSSASSAASAGTTPSASASASGAVDEATPHHHAPVHGLKLVFPAAERGKNAHVTGTLVNEGKEAVTITGAATDSAESAEIHETHNGAMSVSKQWVLKPGQKLELTEEGFHINLVELKASMAEGDTLELTLTTTEGPAHLEVGAGKPSAGGHHH